MNSTMNSYIWIHILMIRYELIQEFRINKSKIIYMNSCTHEFIYSFHIWIHMYMHSYNHFIYMNSYNDCMNLYVYEFIYIWIHIWSHINQSGDEGSYSLSALLNFGVFNGPKKNSNCTQFILGLGADKTFTTRWSGGRVQVWVQVQAPACHLAITPEGCSRRQSKV